MKLASAPITVFVCPSGPSTLVTSAPTDDRSRTSCRPAQGRGVAPLAEIGVARLHVQQPDVAAAQLAGPLDAEVDR